jgi:predicted transcriptional regulator
MIMNEEDAINALSRAELLEMTTEIVSAYVSNNTTDTSAVPALIDSVYRTLAGQSEAVAASSDPGSPAVAVKRSVKEDHIVCLDCGRKLKTLKRHLRSEHDLSPADYRAKWSLPSDYPMVAPNYSKARSTFAKQIGLGRSGS